MFNNKYSSSLLEKAVMEINRLPGIGSKTALRLALHLLKQDTERVEALAESLVEMRRGVHYCKVCYNICDDEQCEICSNPQRDSSIVCVVENVQDVMAIENTMQYRGLYHVLGGVISPIEGISPNDLKIAQLVQRTQREDIKEIILALPATIEGDTTNFFIFRQLNDYKGKISVISKGIAVGDALEYVDEVTLGRSIQNRIPFNQK